MRRKALPAVAKPGDPGYGPEECERCGDDMHPVRRSYGFKLCVHCAEAKERGGQRVSAS